MNRSDLKILNVDDENPSSFAGPSSIKIPVKKDYTNPTTPSSNQAQLDVIYKFLHTRKQKGNGKLSHKMK